MPNNVSPREAAAIKVANVINSCQNVEQCFTARKLVEAFQRLHDPQETLPLKSWVLNKECYFANPHLWALLNGNKQ